MTDEPLIETPLPNHECVVTERVHQFAADGLARAKNIECFDFIPSNYEVLYSILDSLPRGRFCEWGSGIGIGVGIATLLGFDAVGVEQNELLTVAGRQLLSDHGIDATLHVGSYFDIEIAADYYFTYCWASYIWQTHQHFAASVPTGAKLLICHGQNEIRCWIRRTE